METPQDPNGQVSAITKWRPWLLRGGIACFSICVILFIIAVMA